MNKFLLSFFSIAYPILVLFVLVLFFMGQTDAAIKSYILSAFAGQCLARAQIQDLKDRLGL